MGEPYRTHYFDKDNGREVKNAIFELDGKSYEADENGIVKELPPYRNQYISENGNDWSYYDGFGHKLIGLHNIDGVNVYFDDNGIQAKGKITTIGTDTYSSKRIMEQCVQISFLSFLPEWRKP